MRVGCILFVIIINDVEQRINSRLIKWTGNRRLDRVACQCNTMMGPKASWKSIMHPRDNKTIFKPENNKMHIKANKILKFRKNKI